MKPFSAWLSSTVLGRPMVFRDGRWVDARFHNRLFKTEDDAGQDSEGPPQRVLIVEDNEDNRRRLGMEG